MKSVFCAFGRGKSFVLWIQEFESDGSERASDTVGHEPDPQVRGLGTMHDGDAHRDGTIKGAAGNTASANAMTVTVEPMAKP